MNKNGTYEKVEIFGSQPYSSEVNKTFVDSQKRIQVFFRRTHNAKQKTAYTNELPLLLCIPPLSRSKDETRWNGNEAHVESG